MAGADDGGDVILWFDFISPYAYVAWFEVHALAARAPIPRGVLVTPILFAALLDANGQKGPAEIPSKRAYTFKDAYRKARRRGLALVPPPTHPFNPLTALRAASVARWDTDGEGQRRAIDALFAAAWRDGAAIDTPAAVAAVLSRAGFDGDAIAEEARSTDAKERLRMRTQAALARGVFGVPSLEADGELFWGVDGLELAEARLRGEDPLPADVASFERTASATRKVIGFAPGGGPR